MFVPILGTGGPDPGTVRGKGLRLGETGARRLKVAVDEKNVRPRDQDFRTSAEYAGWCRMASVCRFSITLAARPTLC